MLAERLTGALAQGRSLRRGCWRLRALALWTGPGRVGAVALLAVASLGAPSASFAAPPARAADKLVAPSELTLRVGEQRLLPTDEVRSYSVGTEGIVDVRLTPDATSFVVVGEQPGTTTLLFLLMNATERNVRVTVEASSPTLEPGNGLGEPKRLHVPAEANIRLDFYFVQLSKTYGHQIGVGWPTSLGGGTFSASYDFLSRSFDSATAVVADQALPRLDLAQAAGWAKIMRQSAVITTNGKPATFGGGGEVNIPVQGALAGNIHPITYGSTLQVLPRYDSESGRIELELKASVSDLTEDGGTGAPGRMTSDLQTIVNLELGQSIVLAGLTARNQARSQRGIPVLSQIPVLGALFGTHAETSRDVENVVIVVPTVAEAVAQDAREHIRDALRTYQEYTGDLDEVDLVPPAAVDASRKLGRAGARRQGPSGVGSAGAGSTGAASAGQGSAGAAERGAGQPGGKP